MFLTLFNVLLCVKVHINLVPAFRENMEKLDKLWHMQMSLTTFILAFFLNRSAGVWSDLLSFGRRIQGRLNDVSILVSMHATRDPATNLVTPRAQRVIDAVARYKRLFPVLFYSSVVKSHECLTTTTALSGMRDRGMITEAERELLAGMPPKQRHHAVVQWIGRTVVDACEEDGVFDMKSNLHFVFVSLSLFFIFIFRFYCCCCLIGKY